MGDSKKTQSLNILLPCLCAFLWGVGYPVLKIACSSWNIATDDISSKMLFAGTRFMLAGVVLILINIAIKRKFEVPSKSMFPQIAILGLCQTTLQYAFLYIGLAHTSGTKGSVLNQLCVFLTVILTPIFFKSEKISLKQIAGCVIGFLGIIVMNLDGFSMNIEYGDFIVLLASCATTAGYMISKAFPKESNVMISTGFQQLFGGLVLCILGLIGGGRIYCSSLTGALSFAFLVLECAIAFSIWFYLLQRYEASKVTIYKFLTPVFGVLFSGLLLGEEILKVENIVSLLLVCAGVIIVNGYKAK